MKQKIAIFEPAMCCETGICGINVDPELVRLARALDALKQHKIKIQRYSLNRAPMRFIQTESINQHVVKHGIKGLPALVVDGEIVIAGRYPTNEELMDILKVPAEYLEGGQVEWEEEPAASATETDK